MFALFVSLSLSLSHSLCLCICILTNYSGWMLAGRSFSGPCSLSRTGPSIAHAFIHSCRVLCCVASSFRFLSEPFAGIFPHARQGL